MLTVLLTGLMEHSDYANIRPIRHVIDVLSDCRVTHDVDMTATSLNSCSSPTGSVHS